MPSLKRQSLEEQKLRYFDNIQKEYVIGKITIWIERTGIILHNQQQRTFTVCNSFIIQDISELSHHYEDSFSSNKTTSEINVEVQFFP